MLPYFQSSVVNFGGWFAEENLSGVDVVVECIDLGFDCTGLPQYPGTLPLRMLNS
jgi:hypothetical protein